MFEVLNLSLKKVYSKGIANEKSPTAVKKISIPLVHVSDSMDELRQLSIIMVMIINFSS